MDARVKPGHDGESVNHVEGEAAANRRNPHH